MLGGECNRLEDGKKKKQRWITERTYRSAYRYEGLVGRREKGQGSHEVAECKVCFRGWEDQLEGNVVRLSSRERRKR